MKNIHRFKAKLAMLNQQGFTLVEVLIALLVLGIIFVPVSNAFLQSVHLNQHMKQRVTAVREAQAAMEVTLSLLNELDISEPDISEEASEKDEEVKKYDDIQVNYDNQVNKESSDKSDKVGHYEPDQQIDEQIVNLLANFDTSDLIKTETIVDIAPLHDESPFFIITATSNYATKGFTNTLTLTSIHLPSEAPWLTPKEYRVVTP